MTRYAKMILTTVPMILCTGLLMQQNQAAAEDVVAPNLAFSSPEFPDRTPDFLYTGEQITPEFSLRLPGQDAIPAGCENSSVRYCSVSIPFACAFAIIKYRIALHAVTFAVL